MGAKKMIAVAASGKTKLGLGHGHSDNAMLLLLGGAEIAPNRMKQHTVIKIGHPCMSLVSECENETPSTARHWFHLPDHAEVKDKHIKNRAKFVER